MSPHPQPPSISGNRSKCNPHRVLLPLLLKRAYLALVQFNSRSSMRRWAPPQPLSVQPLTSRRNNNNSLNSRHSSSRWWCSTVARIFRICSNSNSSSFNSSRIARRSLRTTRTRIWDRLAVFSSRGSQYRSNQPDWPSLWRICKCRQVPIFRRADFRILTAWSRNDVLLQHYSNFSDDQKNLLSSLENFS